MEEKIYIFDEEGARYEVTNIEALLEELPDEGLESIYKSTRYFHEFNKTVLELIERKIIEQTEGKPYDVEGVERGMKAFETKIIEKMGSDVLAEFIKDTDAQWEENKPETFNIPNDDIESTE